MSTREGTREKLLVAAEKVFAEKGYYEAAVDEIVRQSSTSKGSVYFHFPNKESLFLAVMDHLGDRLLQRVERSVADVTDPAEKLDMALTTTLETLTRHRTLAKLLLSKGVSLGSPFARKRTKLFGRFAFLVKGLLEQAAPPTEGPRPDPEVIAYAWLGAISEVVTKWLETGKPHPTREALPTLRVLLVSGVGMELQATRGSKILD